MWLLAMILGTVVLSGCSEGPTDTVSVVGWDVAQGIKSVAPAIGPLKVHPTNPRYFTDGGGKAVYLTGSHHWNNLLNTAEIGQPMGIFDYPRYLDFLVQHNHNFMRMWVIEGGVNHQYVDLFPYARTGPGVALDGMPRFNLDQFDQTFFDRLRSRVVAARDRGIYVSIMLFNGWSVYDHGYGNPWPVHPFNQANNANGVNGDPNGDGEGKELQTLHVRAITDRQKAYIEKIVDTVNHLDNVLYEISNESEISSREWQYHMIRFVKHYEATKPKQHPVGMTSFDTNPIEASQQAVLEVLLSSPADWISPCNDGEANYGLNPPTASGRKVVLSDTDHFFPIGGDHDWVWKTFMRGINPVYMDPIDQLAGTTHDPPGARTARMAMGHTRSYANKIDLAAMVPDSRLCSTGYCLAHPGYEYVAYLPFGSHWLEPWIKFLPLRLQRWTQSLNLFHRTVTVDLSGGPELLRVEWFDPVKGTSRETETATGGSSQTFTVPFRGEAVLYLRAIRQ